MLRRTPLFSALDPAVVSSGLQPDKHDLHKVLWEAAENVVFFGGKVKRRVPPILAFDAGTDPIRGLSQQQATDGVRWLWAASGGRVVRWYAGSPDEIIAAADWQEDETLTALPTLWDFTHYGNWTIINSGKGAAQIVKAISGSDPPPPPTDFGNAPEDVAAFQKFKSFIMAFGYGDRGTRVGWSSSSDIEDWNPDTTDDAGALSVDDLDTRIKAVAWLGSAKAVYAEDQMGLISFIGQPFTFGQRVLLDGIGVVSKAAVCSDGKNNLGVGRGGIWWTDGNSYRYIDEGFLHDYLQEEVNWLQAGKISAVRNDHTGCFNFFFPMRDSLIIDEGWAFDPRTGGWSMIETVSMKDERKLFQKPVIGLDDGSIWLDDSSPTTLAPLVLRTRPLLMQVQSAEGWGDTHTSVKIDEIDLLLKEAQNVQFRVGSQQDTHAEFEWTAWLEAQEGTRTYLLPHCPDGVYWKLEFRSIAAEWKLNLQGFIMFGAVEGTKRDQQ
jgi:hypothetical protein